MAVRRFIIGFAADARNSSLFFPTCTATAKKAPPDCFVMRKRGSALLQVNYALDLLQDIYINAVLARSFSVNIPRRAIKHWSSSIQTLFWIRVVTGSLIAPGRDSCTTKPWFDVSAWSSSSQTALSRARSICTAILHPNFT